MFLLGRLIRHIITWFKYGGIPLSKPNIVTLYNSPNCGAFLQGFALGDVLCDMTGSAPRYLETGARSVKPNPRAVMKASIKSRDFKRWPFEKKKADNFFRALEDYEVVEAGFDFSDNDLLVFGSDEIWNLRRCAITDYPALWGSGLRGGVRVSYAPSANGANLSAAACADDFKRSLLGFSQLSARDPATQTAVRELTGRSVALVCDPTLLLDVERYRVLEVEPGLSNYLLVYSYGTKMTKDDAAAIREFASTHGLKVISAGTKLAWCDLSIPAGPFEFLGLMDNAEYVVTDTFHGSVFASIYHKRFVSFGRTNSKVIEFMNGYRLEERMVTGGRVLEECLLAEPDFSAFDACWSDMRVKSLAYLQRTVDLCAQKSGDVIPKRLIKVEKGVNLAPLTTFKMGGKAARLWEPKRGDDLRALPKGKNGFRVISAGSNLLVSDRTFTDVISMRDFDDTIEDLGNGEYRVGASVRVQRLISKVNADGYGGIEALVSVPAMVGGLICMNASVPSTKTCISDHLVSVEVFDGENSFEVPKAECGFGYRASAFQDGHALILGACFKFPEQDPTASAVKVDARRKYVKEAQDKSAPNFGSVFRESSGKAMGLIRKRGLAVGGISFSRKTRNWILNEGGSFDDAMSLLGKAIAMNRLFGKKAKLEVRVWR